MAVCRMRRKICLGCKTRQQNRRPGCHRAVESGQPVSNNGRENDPKIQVRGWTGHAGIRGWLLDPLRLQQGHAEFLRHVWLCHLLQQENYLYGWFNGLPGKEISQDNIRQRRRFIPAAFLLVEFRRPVAQHASREMRLSATQPASSFLDFLQRSNAPSAAAGRRYSDRRYLHSEKSLC